MKFTRKIYNLLLLAFFAGIMTAHAANELTANPTTLPEVYGSASDGDVILLDGGVYSTPVAFPAGKSITLKANPTAASDVEFVFQLGEPSAGGGSLTFDGLLINRSNNDYFFSSSTSFDMSAWKFVNCTIKNIKNSLFDTKTKSGHIDNFILDNCVIFDCGTSKTCFIFCSQTVGSFTVKNSTIYNYKGGDFFKPNNATTAKNIEVSFLNNTMYKCIWDGGYGWASVGGVYPAGNTYLFRNNIFDQGASTGQPLLVYKGNGTVTEENNIKIGYQNNYGTTTNAANLTLGVAPFEEYDAVPYADPATGNFSLSQSSPFATAGAGSSCVGAPRWIKGPSDPRTLTVIVSPANAGTVSSQSVTVDKGERAVVTATANFGFRFKEWRDKDNNLLSVNATLSRIMTESETVTALFEVRENPILYANPDNFVSLYNSASDEDIILLDAGTYSQSVKFPAGKSLTLKADPDAKSVPVINFQIEAPAGAEGSVTFENLIIDRNGSDYFFSMEAAVNMSEWNFKNCTIRNIRKSLIEDKNTAGTIGGITIDNCVISGCGTSRAGFITVYKSVSKMTVSNSTINNYTGGNFFNVTSNAGTSAIAFSFANNTVYKSIWDDTYSICSAAYGYNGNSTFRFENNIFDRGADSGQPRLLYSRNGGNVTEQNNIKVGYAGNYRTGGGSETVNNLTLGEGTLTGIHEVPYKNAANGDFSIPSTSPIATAGTSGKCVGDPRWIIAISNPVTVTTVSNPVAGGVVSPATLTVNKGDEVTLSATANFGYRFVNWKKGDAVISSQGNCTYPVDEDCTLTATFEAIATYQLGVDLKGGANDYMVKISPAGTMVDGKRMYETGTIVTLSTISNPIVNFLSWEDGNTDDIREIMMDGDKQLNAEFVAADYIVGWDFYLKGGSARKPDFISTVDNTTSQLVVRDEAGNVLGWLDKSIEAANGVEGLGGAVIWKQLPEKHYFQTKINASEFRDIHLSSKMVYNYNAYKVQQMQWSLNGTDWVTVASLTFPGAKQWMSLEADLPANANNAAELYIRWIPDFSAGYSETAADASTLNGIGLAAVYVTGNKEIPNDPVAPRMVASTPENNAVGISARGKIILTFDKKIKLADDAKAVVGNKEFALNSGATTVWINYSGLDYDTKYTFVLPKNQISNLSGSVLTEDITISFRTMPRPVVNPKLFDYIVKAGDAEDFKAAVATANAATGLSRYRIFVPAGTYDLGTTTYTTIRRSNISLVGEGMGKTIILNKPASSGIGTTATLFITDNIENTYIQDLTIRNAWPYLVEDGGDGGGVAVAFQDSGDKSILKNVQLKSFQDTYFSSSDKLRSYFEDSQIHGTVDFICGNGNIFFNRTNLYLEKRDGCVIVAPRGDARWGYVFNNCTIGGLASNDGTYRLGRPWGNMCHTVYLNTTMELLPTAEGWGDMGGNVPKVFAEYNSRNAHGLVVDCNTRKKYYNVNNVMVPYEGPAVLSDEQAAQYTIENILGGTDGWNPTLYTEQVEAPSVTFGNNRLSWSSDAYSLCYLIYCDGKFMSQTTEVSFAPEVKGSYVVYAANEMGGLSAASNAVQVDSLTSVDLIEKEDSTLSDVYGIDGRLVMKQVTRKDAVKRLSSGIYIIGGKKMVINH